MDNRKIGKLIASLRNKEGLTQQELGDKIGVGFRAVSKWERGLNLPDIGNMTELSKIFGITLDELMAGELKQQEEPKTKKKLSPKITIIISIITTIIFILTSILIYYSNKTYVYDMYCDNTDEYYIEGKVTFERNETSIIVHNLNILDKKTNSTKVKNYEYKVYANDTIIFGYGSNDVGNQLEKETTIGEIASKFRINYTDEFKLKRIDIINNKILLIITFIQEDKTKITKEIEISLFPTT